VNAADISIPNSGAGPTGGYLEVNGISNAEKISANKVELNALHAQGSFVSGKIVNTPITVRGQTGVNSINNLRNLTYGPANGSVPQTIYGTANGTAGAGTLILRADRLSLDQFGTCTNCTP
jgi:hypothetical protein